MNFNLSPKAVLKFLLFSVAILFVMQIVVLIAPMVPGHGRFMGIVREFDFNHESNIPTLYSSINLMLSALLLFCIAMKHKSAGKPWISWMGLACVMGFLSIDETASIHEKLIDPTQSVLGVSDATYYVWIFPYILAVAVLGLLYFKFFMRLPARTRALFILSGVIFISGAAGLEIHGNIEQARQANTFAYSLSSTFEELLEMLGVICFIYALMDYAVSQFQFFTVTLAPQTSRYRRQTPEKLRGASTRERYL